MMNRIICFCVGLCLISLFGFLLITIVSVCYPNSNIASLFGNNERNITIGLLFFNNTSSISNDPSMDESILELNDRMLNSTLIAIKSINEIIYAERKENYFSSSQVKKKNITFFLKIENFGLLLKHYFRLLVRFFSFSCHLSTSYN